jgi:hypothetical protein
MAQNRYTPESCPSVPAGEWILPLNERVAGRQSSALSGKGSVCGSPCMGWGPL